MARSPKKPVPAFGFLTVVDDAQLGTFGGFLVLNASGRPLEFHCTTPVKANRAQEILYGPTLKPFLYGEQIAATLVSKAANPVAVVCTDLPEVLAMRDHVEAPAVLVLGSSEATESLVPVRVDPPHGPGGPLTTFQSGRHQLAVAAERAADQQTILTRLEPLGEFDLTEPFVRIRDAIAEAAAGNR